MEEIKTPKATNRRIDIPFIEYLCKSKGLKVQDLCERIGMTERTYYNKASGATSFTWDEISGIIDVLEIENDQIVKIFFAPSVP